MISRETEKRVTRRGVTSGRKKKRKAFSKRERRRGGRSFI